MAPAAYERIERIPIGAAEFLKGPAFVGRGKLFGPGAADHAPARGAKLRRAGKSLGWGFHGVRY